jgi:hypothetical protein
MFAARKVFTVFGQAREEASTHVSLNVAVNDEPTAA